MSLTNEVAAYLNVHYSADLKRLTEGEEVRLSAWGGGVAGFNTSAPRLEAYAAFRLMNGILAKTGNRLLRIVLEGGDKNRFEACE